METATLLFTLRFGILAMALGQLFSSVMAQLINAWPNRKLLAYPYLQQLRDMLPAVALSCTMAALVFAVTRLGLPDLLTLLIQVPLGMGLYVLGAWVLKLESFRYILGLLQKYRAKKEAAE